MAAGQPLDAESFDLDRAWTLSPGVALRPEKFGALAYDFRSRRLSMLKDPALVAVVRRLAEHSTARDALAVSGVDTVRSGPIVRALATLARSGMIRPRAAP
jgi:mycofactocin biosynthesis protein MftB